MSHNYEVEVKSLLGNQENADALIQRLTQKLPDIKKGDKVKQLNHYFNIDGDFLKLLNALQKHISESDFTQMQKTIDTGSSYSLRSRDTNGEVRIVIKASVDETSSANGIARIEFEAIIPLSLAELDEIILNAGFTYQAKWSRERTEYTHDDVSVSLDKNAGYGYVAEFERVVNDESLIHEAREFLRTFMKELGVDELPQDRLMRMFDHYNHHWQDFYGTENTFIIE